MHLILLGVESVAESTRFYEALGWKKSPTGNEGFAKFDMGGYAISNRLHELIGELPVISKIPMAIYLKWILRRPGCSMLSIT
jgi:hypothetical protein